MALSAALDAIELPLALLVGGDMPALQPALLAAMVTALIERSADVVILAGPGPFQSIPAAMRVAPARAAARESLAAGSRSLRALNDRLDVAVLPEAAWRVFDPEGATLRDVDTPADLPPERRSRPPAAS
jgi:molybdopterin-guanine dinucleotide biosynthesis protein A